MFCIYFNKIYSQILGCVWVCLCDGDDDACTSQKRIRFVFSLSFSYFLLLFLSFFPSIYFHNLNLQGNYERECVYALIAYLKKCNKRWNDVVMRILLFFPLFLLWLIYTSKKNDLRRRMNRKYITRNAKEKQQLIWMQKNLLVWCGCTF